MKRMLQDVSPIIKQEVKNHMREEVQKAVSEQINFHTSLKTAKLHSDIDDLKQENLAKNVRTPNFVWGIICGKSCRPKLEAKAGNHFCDHVCDQGL